MFHCSLIQSLEAELQELGVIVSFNSEVTGIQVIGSNEFRLEVTSSEDFIINSGSLVVLCSDTTQFKSKHQKFHSLRNSIKSEFAS